ncbi:MAG: tetratricopeptide repeat protein [Planctomycetaceae bacterium]
MRVFHNRLPTVLLVLATASLALSSGCNSGSGWTRNALGKRSYNNGDYTTARRSFEQALMSDPYNPNYAFNVAAAMQKQGDDLAAERMYQHALTLNPSHQPSYHGLAGLLQQQGRGNEAQELLTAWVDTQPYSAESHVEMAYMQQQMGDYTAAEASLQQALRQNPRHARAMAQLGQVYQQTGRNPQAAALYNRSLAYNRSQPQVAAQLGQLGYANQYSPSLMMAQQMPQYDPTLTAFSQFQQPQMATAPTYNTGSPYTAFMAPQAMNSANGLSPMSPQYGLMNGSPINTAELQASGWQLVSSNVVSGPTEVPGSAAMPTMAQYSSPTTVTTAPTMTGAGLNVTATGMVPAYAPQSAQFGNALTVPRTATMGTPVINATMPVVSAF